MSILILKISLFHLAELFKLLTCSSSAELYIIYTLDKFRAVLNDSKKFASTNQKLLNVNACNKFK